MRLVLWLMAAPLLVAQTGALNGRVVDPTEAAIPGAKLTVTADGFRREAVSQADGSFALDKVPLGRVSVETVFAGFNSARESFDLGPAGRRDWKIVLAPSGTTERIDVAAAAEMLQTSRATVVSAINSREIQSLPTASRNYTHLIVAEAGVAAPLPDRTGRGMNVATTPGAQGDDGTQSLNPSVNGARTTNNAFAINGLDATNMMNGNGSLGNNITVPLDALEVVEVQTALFSAATGRNGGGNIQMITRSGSNDFHGTVAHFLQNERLNANEFFLNRAGTRRPKFRRNETSATFGGRLIKDKTFFFTSVQRTDFTSGFASRATAQSGIPEGLGDVRTRDSIAEVANRWLQGGAAGNPLFARNFLNSIRAFPAEQIPGLEAKFFSSVTDPAIPVFRRLTAADIHPVAINVLNVRRNGQFLLPSATSSMPLLTGNASFGPERQQTLNFPTAYNNWSGAATLEHHFTGVTRLRLNYVKSAQFVEEAFGWANSSPSPTQGQTPSYTASMSLSHSFTPTLFNELRGGFFELHNTRISLYRDVLNSTLGIFNPIEKALGGLASLMPTIDINTWRSTAGIGNAWDFFDRQRVINIADNVTWTRGKHQIQFGGEFRRPTIAGEYMARTNGDLDYNNWVLFFTGHGAAGGGSDLDMGDTRRHFKMRDYAFFAQDDWRARKNLTFNAGIRYEFFSYPNETQGRIGSYYTPSMAARAGVQPGYQIPANSGIFNQGFDPLQLGLVLAPGTQWNLNQVHRSKWASTIAPDYNNLAPRVGFAWQPSQFGNRVSVRGGYGIFFERPSGAFKSEMQLSAPFFIYQNVPAPEDMANPYPRLNINPFAIPLNVTVARNAQGTPSWRRADGSAFPATEPFAAKNFSFIDPFVATPYTQQWTFNLQLEPWQGNMIDIRYVGTRGTKLLARLNMAQPLDPRVTRVNGFTSITNSAGALINPDFFVPSEFLGLGRANGFRLRSNWASSTYHGLQVNLRRRFQRGLFWNVSYTWSKSIDTISNDGGTVEHDAFNIRANRGLADFDRAHRFTASYIYELPRLFHNRYLDGWSLNGMVTLQTGAPFSIIGNATRNAFWAQVGRVRMDWAQDATIDNAINTGRVQDRLENYFNTAAFADSLDRWGDTGRNILRGPAQRQFDFSLGKAIPFSERLRGEFRWELFNAFNQTTFASPASTFAANGPGTAGRITSTIGGPRTMQGAVRLRF